MKDQNEKRIAWLCQNDECCIIQGLTKMSQKNQNQQTTYYLEVINQSRQNEISQIEIYVPTEVIFQDEVTVFNVKPLITTQENGKLKFVCAIFYTDPLTQETIIAINASRALDQPMIQELRTTKRTDNFDKRPSNQVGRLSQASNQLSQGKVFIKTSRLILQNQQHSTQFPVLCQNTFHPKNNRIIFTNLVKNCKKQVVQLPVGFIFVKFVQEAAQYNRGKKSTDPVDDFGKVQIFVLAQEQSTCAYHILMFETQPFYDCNSSEGSQEEFFNVSQQENKLSFKSFLLHEPSQNMNPIKFAFVNQIRQKKQNKYLLVLQTSQKIWFYLDGVLQTTDKALPRTAPVPMIQGICNTYFYVGRDEIGTDCVVGIQIPTSYKNQALKPTFKILHQQQQKIVQLNSDEARSNLGNGEGVFLHIDEDGIIKEYFYSFISNDLQLKPGVQTHQYQTFKLKESRVGIMEKIANCAWKSHIFSAEVIYSFQKGRLLEFFTQTQQLRVQADKLKINIKQFRNNNDYSEQATYTQQVASIDRFCFAFKTEDGGGYILLKPIPKSLQINFISNISSQFCSNAHFTKEDIVFEVSNQQSTRWIQFSSATLMIERVIQYSEQKPSIIYTSCPSRKKYIICEDDHSLYDYQDQKEMIYPQHNKLIEREEDLLQKIQDYDKNRNFDAIESVKILMDQPILTQSGQSIIVSLLNPNFNYKSPQLQKDKTLDAVANESLIRIKKLTTNVMQPLVKNSNKQNLEHHIETDFLSKEPTVTVNYLIIEKTEDNIDQDFAMQVVVTKNFLVWTTPNFVNFAKLEDIDNDQAQSDQDKQISGTETEFVTSKENQKALRKLKKVLNAKLVTKLASTPFIKSDGVKQYQHQLSTQLGEILKQKILTQIELQKNIKNFVKNLFQHQGIIRKQIALTTMFTAQEIKNLKIFALSENDKEFVARDSQQANDDNLGEKCKRSRLDLLQIRTKKISAIWDLEQCEEITYLSGWKQIAQQPIRTGHILSHNDYEIVQNQKSNLFIQRGDEGEILIQRLYSTLGIRFLQYTQHMLQHKQKLAYENVYFSALTQNFMDRSLLSLFHEHYQLVDYCRLYLETLDKDSTVVTDSYGHFIEYDKIFLRQFYQILLLPVILGNEGLELSELAQKFQLKRRKSQKIDASTVLQSLTSQQKKNSQKQVQKALKHGNKKIQTILHYSLHEDKLLFNYLCKMITLSKDVRLSNFVTTFEDFEKFFGTRTTTVDQFMQQAYIRTEYTQKIKVLWAQPNQGHLYFQSNSPLLNDEQIENGFLNSNYDNKLDQTQLNILSKLGIENQEELVPFEVEILEVEWLEEKNQEFMISITNHDDETVYDDPLIKFFLREVNYKTRIIQYVLIPYLIYAICLIVYFTFCLTIEGGSGIGYFKGKTEDIVLRTIILILGLYFAFLECWSMFTNPSSYLKSLRNYIYWIHLLLNQYLITEDSTYFTRRTGLEVSRVASVMIIVVWIYLYFWLRIFRSTAIYVQMINTTIYDIKEYMLVFIMCLMMFGNGILVLDNYMLQYDAALEIYGEENTYQPIIMSATGGRYFDAFVQQYQTVMGAFDTSGYNQQNVGLLWIYFFGTTFITNIMILNMLIAIMGQTYETVSESRERNTLIMSTNIQTDYIFLLGKKQIFGQYRYLYLAKPIIEGENKSFDIQSTVKKLQNQLEESNSSQIESSQKMLLELAQLKQQVLTLSQKMEESSVFTEEERQEIKKVISQKKSQEDQNDVGEQLKMLKRQQDDLNQNVLKILSQLRPDMPAGTQEGAKLNQ